MPRRPAHPRPPRPIEIVLAAEGEGITPDHYLTGAVLAARWQNLSVRQLRRIQQIIREHTPPSTNGSGTTARR